MPIEIIINTSEEYADDLWVDGHLVFIRENVKRLDILEALEYMGYITIKTVEK